MDMLIFVEGPQKGQRYPVGAGRLTLGRDRQNDIPVDDSGSSRNHAVIERGDAGVVLRDQNSTNGTFVNSRRITATTLKSGDRISIGDTVIIFESTRSSARPSVMVSELRHDKSRDITVQMDSTVFLSAGALMEAHAEAQEQVLALFNFISRISGVLDLEELLPLALREMVGVIRADRGAILFLDKAEQLVPQVTFPEGSGNVVISRTITDSVLATRQGVLSNPGGGDSALRDTVSIRRRDVGSIICVPLMSEDRVLGVVYADTRAASKAFTPRSLHLFSAMAMQLAIAVQNARLYRSLRNSEEFAACILKSMVSGIFVVDEREMVVRTNDAACAILGIEQKELVGLAMASDPRLRELAAMVRETRATGIPQERAEINARIGERDVPLGVTTSVLEDYTGKVCGVICMFRDLTRLKKLAEELKRSRHLAALGEMAAGIAHEVRNPLNSVFGFAQLLQESAQARQDRQEQEYAGIILDEVNRINKIVQDMLDFSRQREVTMSLVDLRALVGAVVEQLRHDPENAGKTIDFDPGAGTGAKVMGSADKLKQLLINIIQNGCQACAVGGTVAIDITTGRNPAAVYPEAVVRVRDNGGGIPAGVMEKIFDPFFTTKDVGTGLGLPICQKIAELHAGRIEVESASGLGSTFSIHLPMKEE